jgi:hypothetical protein
MKSIIQLLLCGHFVVCIFLCFGYAFYWYTYKRIPSQPIAFSHKTHLTKVGLACVDCHKYADVGLSPGVPPVSKCMSCHAEVKKTSPEIIKLTEFWNNTTPVPWIKVHNLPTHVYFSHKRHIKRGISCETCHGQVKGMDEIKQVRSLNMGMCVSCHREPEYKAPTDCLTCHK